MAILLTENCIGCGACKSACLPGSIELRQEEIGFFRAYISEEGCTGCGRCKIVCPQLRSNRATPEAVFAYQNPIRTELERSQSGGAFAALARTVIEQGGIVYGVQWNKNCTKAFVRFFFERVGAKKEAKASRCSAANLLSQSLPKRKRHIGISPSP